MFLDAAYRFVANDCLLRRSIHETGGGTVTDTRENRSRDEHIKNLPKGQMEILMTDDTQGTLHSLLHVRAPNDVTLPGFEPKLYKRAIPSRADSQGAYLRFKDASVTRGMKLPRRVRAGQAR